MTYVACYFHAFSSMGMFIAISIEMTRTYIYDIDQAETVSRRVEKFAELMQSVWLSRNDYERRVREVRDTSPSKSSWTDEFISRSFSELSKRSKRNGRPRNSMGPTRAQRRSQPLS